MRAPAQNAVVRPTHMRIVFIQPRQSKNQRDMTIVHYIKRNNLIVISRHSEIGSVIKSKGERRLPSRARVVRACSKGRVGIQKSCAVEALIKFWSAPESFRAWREWLCPATHKETESSARSDVTPSTASTHVSLPGCIHRRCPAPERTGLAEVATLATIVTGPRLSSALPFLR